MFLSVRDRRHHDDIVEELPMLCSQHYLCMYSSFTPISTANIDIDFAYIFIFCLYCL